MNFELSISNLKIKNLRLITN